ncbi:MAG: ornithine cyclodeaminase [Pseudotabrizicola sp.]|uniref:ornithine cyclodeaminase family protein n=1 Tax=Pseudotabrizicola sp. TaxID=2939647 RepID=UPI00272F323F|nr:ornithine cyclodeaminase [Pseudotabrizicola sp.]MDP2082156.1 ornithine cyclodeaminase [Pseudotabrizicola sp.]MDZ7576549.1 ornithine cyclodeaminase [Pseudotabrizicola sp.]
MTVQIIGQEVEPRLTWDGLTAALEAGHRRPRAEIRDMVLYRGGDTLLNRAAWIDGLGQLVKVATVFPGNGGHGLPSVNGAVTLYDDQTGVLTALVDFHLVTKWKTAGDSLLSAKRLARKDSRRILLVGAGTVARSMISAYSSLFAQAEFTVWSRNRATAQAMGHSVADDLETAVRAADIICTATMSREPLVMGAWLQPGQHLDLIGAYTPAMREVDDEAMARARVFVDSRATTIGHIGEVIEPIKSGAISEADVIADFYDDPTSYVRRSADDITIAKNGGGAHLDLMTADYISRVANAG